MTETNKDGTCRICCAAIGAYHQAYCTHQGVHKLEHVERIFRPEPVNPIVPPIERVLEGRGKSHGDFADNALVSQAIKEIARNSGHWHSLTPIQKEALDAIALKLSRILSGKANFIDHWEDISGYATLVVNSLIPPGQELK